MKITNYTDLEVKILQLRQEKELQENEVKYSFHQFVHTLNPVTILKDSLHNLTKDKTAQMDLAAVGLNLGTNFIIEKTLGKYSSIKGFIGSMLLENFSVPFINNNSSQIISLIGNLFNKDSKKK